jgi:hypothetical protein
VSVARSFARGVGSHYQRFAAAVIEVVEVQLGLHWQ